MHIVCEVCKFKSPFPTKTSSSKLTYCWSHASYSDWLVHIISKVHQQNSLMRLHETLAVTRSLPLEDDEDIGICYYPQSLSIVVHGKFSSYSITDKNDFIGEFLQYGLIRDILFLSVQPETFYVLVFESETTVNQVLKKHHYIANQQVNVENFSYHKCISVIDSADLRSPENGTIESSDRVEKDPGQDISCVPSLGSDFSDAETEIIEPTNSTSKLSVILPFPSEEISLPVTTLLDAEFQTLIKFSGFTKHDIEKRRIVIGDLLDVFKKDFPDCSVIPFGSTVTGLGTSASNIDISIHNTFEDSKMSVEQIRNTLESSKCFSIEIQQAAAQSPMIKCTCIHIATDMVCDISLNNEIGIRQTRLISFYLDFDPRVRILIRTVKHWADLHQLTGLRGMKTYGISLLVIVFLTKMEIVPSVMVLQSLRDKSHENNCQSEEWDLEFCTDKAKVKQFMSLRDTYSFIDTELTALNILRLMKEFFDFCSRVDFNNNMICTLLCSAFPKAMFTHGKISELPPTLEPYLKWVNSLEAVKHVSRVIRPPMHRFDVRGSFSIQDPLNLSLNVSSETTSEVLHRFLLRCDVTSRSINQLLNIKNGPMTLKSIFPQNSPTFAKTSKDSGETFLTEDLSWRNACSSKQNSIKTPSKSKSKPKANSAVQKIEHKNWRNPVVSKSALDSQANSSSTVKTEELEKEFERLMKRIVPPENDPNQITTVVEEMKMILKDSFPQCQVNHFGSTFTRLGSKHSHIDVSFHQFLDFQNNVSKMEYILELLVDSKKFAYVGLVTDGLEPIWQCVHTKSRLICDVFHSNDLGVQTSRLIHFYLEFDTRVRPLAVLIGHMAGNGHFKNSSLILLMLFFLMNRQIIPCVQELQILTEESIYVDGWNISFCTDIGAIKEYYAHQREYMTQESMAMPVTARSVLDLAHGFFDFYASLDFKNNVLCPFLGSLIPKKSFSPVNANSLLPPPLRSNGHFSTFKRVVLIDPFNLARNVERNSKKNVIAEFNISCSQAAKGFYELLRTKNKVITLYHVINGSVLPCNK